MRISINNQKILKLKGVYCIKNLVNNKLYVGSTTTSFKRRYLEHLRKLKINKHHNVYLNKAVIKYNIENFEFCILEVINSSDTRLFREKEAFFINLLNSIKKGYNFSDNTLAPPLNLEAKKRISVSLKEKYITDDLFRIRLKGYSDKRKGIPSWNKGKKCESISKARINMFDDIEVYNLDMVFFRKFDNPIEIEKFSRQENNDLPIPSFVKIFNKTANKFSKRTIKNKVVLSTNIHRAIRTNTPHKGLFFKKVKREK